MSKAVVEAVTTTSSESVQSDSELTSDDSDEDNDDARDLDFIEGRALAAQENVPPKRARLLLKEMNAQRKAEKESPSKKNKNKSEQPPTKIRKSARLKKLTSGKGKSNAKGKTHVKGTGNATADVSVSLKRLSHGALPSSALSAESSQASGSGLSSKHQGDGANHNDNDNVRMDVGDIPEQQNDIPATEPRPKQSGQHPLSQQGLIPTDPVPSGGSSSWPPQGTRSYGTNQQWPPPGQEHYRYPPMWNPSLQGPPSYPPPAQGQMFYNPNPRHPLQMFRTPYPPPQFPYMLPNQPMFHQPQPTVSGGPEAGGQPSAANQRLVACVPPPASGAISGGYPPASNNLSTTTPSVPVQPRVVDPNVPAAPPPGLPPAKVGAPVPLPVEAPSRASPPGAPNLVPEKQQPPPRPPPARDEALNSVPLPQEETPPAPPPANAQVPTLVQGSPDGSPAGSPPVSPPVSPTVVQGSPDGLPQQETPPGPPPANAQVPTTVEGSPDGLPPEETPPAPPPANAQVPPTVQVSPDGSPVGSPPGTPPASNEPSIVDLVSPPGSPPGNPAPSNSDSVLPPGSPPSSEASSTPPPRVTVKSETSAANEEAVHTITFNKTNHFIECKLFDNSPREKDFEKFLTMNLHFFLKNLTNEGRFHLNVMPCTEYLDDTSYELECEVHTHVVICNSENHLVQIHLRKNKSLQAQFFQACNLIIPQLLCHLQPRASFCMYCASKSEQE